MLNSSYYDYEWDSNYCYPNCFILKNKLNIKDENLLEEAERQITSIKILEIKMCPIKGSLDFKHFLKIHKHIFEDIYTWAGKTRSVNISKGNEFCKYIHISTMCEEVFSNLQKENYLIGLSLEDIITRLAYYLGEFNAIHPFREGNGRTQRVFIEYLAQVAGYYVDFSEVTSEEMIAASVDSFACNYKKMEYIFSRTIHPIAIKEQEAFIKSLVPRNSSLFKFFISWKQNY